LTSCCRDVSPGRRSRNPTSWASDTARSGWTIGCRPLIFSHLRLNLSAAFLWACRQTAGSS
jgi:hypothetical protein